MVLHILHDMFALGLPIAEKILRPIIVYVFLIVALRLAGKRELAQLNPFDLVVLLTLSNTVQNAIIGDDNSVTGGLIGAATLLLVNYLVVRYLYDHEKLERFVEGDPDVLIEGGVLKMDNLRAELITLSELQAAAHKQGFGIARRGRPRGDRSRRQRSASRRRNRAPMPRGTTKSSSGSIGCRRSSEGLQA